MLAETTDAANGVTFTPAKGDTPATATKSGIVLKQQKADWMSDIEIAGKGKKDIPSTGTVTVTVKGDGTWECTSAAAEKP